MENKWVTCKEVIAPFVTSIKVYLPLGDYTNTTKQHTITTTTLTNDLGSYPHYNKNVRYILPISQGSYITTYEEGHDICAGSLMDNPYGKCNKPKLTICDSTQQDVQPILRPTILSTWKLSYIIFSGHNRLEWIAPKPANKLYLRAKVCNFIDLKD